MAVIHVEAIITDAKGMYSHMKIEHTRESKLLKICNHTREFFLVESIKRDRPERSIKTSVKGTRKMHAVRDMTPGIICTRNIGCVCHSCLIGEDNCNNDSYTSTWKVQSLHLQIPQVQRIWRQARGAGVAQQGPRRALQGHRCARQGQRGARQG